MRALAPRAKLLTVVVVLSNLAGNTLLSFGMKGSNGLLAILNPAVLAGIALLILWTLTRATLLSWADLSYVLPVTAVGYVLTAGAGVMFLNESISPGRWAATVLIVAGVILAGSTPARTAKKDMK